MNIKIPRFSWALARNFLLSTAIPIAIITMLIANAYSQKYSSDISTLVSTTLDTTSRNLNTYLLELEQASLMPYYNEDFFSILGEIQQKDDTLNTIDKMKLENSVGNMLSFSQYTRDDIVSTLIVRKNTCLFNTTSLINRTIINDYPFSQTDWYQAAIQAKGTAVFLPPHYTNYYEPQNEHFQNPKVISIARAIVNLKTREPLCVIKIDANTSTFDKIFQEITWHVPSIILVTDDKNNLVYCNDFEDSAAINTLKAETDTIKYNDQLYYAYHKQEMSYNWTVHVLLDKRSIDNKSNYIYIIAIILYLLGILFACILYGFHSRKMVNSVNTIQKMVAEIKTGNYQGEYYFAKNNELQLVIDSVTYITALLQEKINSEYQLTLQQKDLQLKALQSQINPHFIFNTLNGLIALNQIGKSYELERSLYALTHMLRYTLNSTSNTTLEHEMKFLNDYCMLQKLRFGNRLNYSINFPPSSAHFRIPRLLLQPLVENAVIHGIEPLQRPCYLNIDVMEYKENELLITIEDDGAGFDCDNSQKHIGMENVKNRILLLNPKNNFNIESSIGNGTIITITLSEVTINEISDC